MGCSWQPSPALITLASIQVATRCGAPAAGWRTTIASMPIASMVCTVSRRLSPFFTDDDDTENVITSHERRLAAVSNERRVRVRVLVEERHHDLAAQRRDLRDVALGDLDGTTPTGRAAPRGRSRSRSAIDKQVLHAGSSSSSSPELDAVGSPSSVSARRTRTSSPSLVGRFLPT